MFNKLFKKMWKECILHILKNWHKKKRDSLLFYDTNKKCYKITKNRNTG